MSGVASQLVPLDMPPLCDEPLVSVLMTNFNYAEYIAEAIESVLRQTYQNVELCVCDDASTDDSWEVIQSYVARDSRVKAVRHDSNAGMAAGFNDAYALCSGAVICLLDSDDVFLDTKIGSIVREFQRDRYVGVVVHSLLVVHKNLHAIRTIPAHSGFETGWISRKVIRRGGRWRDMPTSALSFRRELADESFPIPVESFRRFADGFLFTVFPLLAHVSAVTEPKALYRVHGANMLANATLDQEKLCSEIKSREQQVKEVNLLLARIRNVTDILDVGLDLTYRHRALTLRLLTPVPTWQSIVDTFEVCRLLIKDDIYRPLARMAGVLMFTVALFLPYSARRWWLEKWLGPLRPLRWITLVHERMSSGLSSLFASHTRNRQSSDP